MKYLTLEGLTRLKQAIDRFFLHKEADESVTGVKTFETDPLFDDDKALIDAEFETETQETNEPSQGD